MFNPVVNSSNPRPIINIHVPNTESQAQLEKIKSVIKYALVGLIGCSAIALLFGGAVGIFLLGFHLLTIGWSTLPCGLFIASGCAATAALAKYIFCDVSNGILLQQAIAHKIAAEAYYTPKPAKPEEMYHG